MEISSTSPVATTFINLDLPITSCSLLQINSSNLSCSCCPFLFETAPEIMADVVGTYEYERPRDKCLQRLTLQADGSVTFKETGETRMETWEGDGEGSWTVDGGVVRVVLHQFRKRMSFKMKTNVPGIEDGVSTQQDVCINVTLEELKNAPTRPGVKNRWRRCGGEAASASESTSKATASSGGVGKFCGNCGSSRAAGAKFCANCGTAF